VPFGKRGCSVDKGKAILSVPTGSPVPVVSMTVGMITVPVGMITVPVGMITVTGGAAVTPAARARRVTTRGCIAMRDVLICLFNEVTI
jgi:hypothetical protein